MLNLKIKLLGGFLPEWGDRGDAGLDLRSNEDVKIWEGETKLIPLGFVTEFANLYVARVCDRSGMALTGRHIFGGIIDSSYRGEWKVVMHNSSAVSLEIKRGDRVAQVLFLPIMHLTIEKTKTLSDSVRGSKGFGASGLC